LLKNKRLILKESTYYWSLGIFIFLITSCNPTKHIPSGELFLKKNKIIIDTRKIDKDNLKSLVKQKTNKKILGIFRFHLWVDNQYKKDSDNRIKTNIGEPAVIYDSLLTARTLTQLKLYADKRGYFDSEVNFTTKKKKNKVKVEYHINAGKPYKIKSIDYVFEDDELKKLSFFILRNTIADLKPGNTFDIDVLDKQREIIKTEMKNLGYYYFNKDYIKYKVDSTIGSKEIAVHLYINNKETKSDSGDSLNNKSHQKYFINNVNIFLSKSFKDKNLYEFDSTRFKNVLVRTDTTFGYKLVYRTRMLNHSISLKKGKIYTLENQQNTYKHLTELRLFKNVNISFEDIGDNKLNANIFLTPALKKSFSIEGIGTHNGGNLGIEGNLIYQNKNLLRGGEQLTIKLNGGLEIQQLINIDPITETSFLGVFNTIEFGPEVNLEFPRFLLPIKLDKFSQKANPKTNLNFLLNIQQRPEYLRNLSQASFGYFWKEGRFKKHFVNPINISIIDFQPTSNFQETLDEETNPFILNSYQDHFINSTTYSFIFNNQRVSKAQDFLYLKTNLEFAGNIQSTYNKITNKTFDNLESSSYNIIGIRYAQFIKADLDLRLYGQTKYSSLVKRINIGIGKPYGNLDVLPFEKSYYGGGANGIRAWQARSLGPGSLSDSLTKNALNQIGELKIEANLEYRFDITSLFEGAAFIDAGNIWILSEDENRPNAEIKAEKFWNDIAIGLGIGLRLDFNFFLIRFDLAAKLKDPSTTTPTKFNLIWEKPTLNLGIGYPF
jgi:outer membrane protein assembly factor BamA